MGSRWEGVKAVWEVSDLRKNCRALGTQLSVRQICSSMILALSGTNKFLHEAHSEVNLKARTYLECILLIREANL